MTRIAESSRWTGLRGSRGGGCILGPSPGSVIRGVVAPTDLSTAVVRHVAIIIDGNRRWARERGLPIDAGHAAGADTLKALVLAATELGVQEMSAYSFSTENWSRPVAEVRALIAMLTERIASDTPDLHSEGVRVRFIGRHEHMPEALLRQMAQAEELTAENRRMSLYIALNYGGRSEVVDAAKRFDGSTEQEFRQCLYAPEMHDPDLIIRTGGEQRLSNYLLWQAAYSELVFCKELWPDFTRVGLERSLEEFAERRRRFGGR